MIKLRNALPIAAMALFVGACQASPAASPSAASSAGPASANPTAPVATDAAPTAGPTAATSAPDVLGGTWAFVASNPRVLAATGDHVGGSVVIEGNRYIFTAGEYRHEAPLGIIGTKDLDCNATRCKIEGVPLHQLMLVDGQLAIVHAANLTPLGAFGDKCAGWQDIPDGGIVSVVSTGMVDGLELPTVVQFADGAAGGVGETCETGSHVVAWDVTATRQP